ncbi:MAG TPA: arsenate reductase ArsC [Lysobacter sp.]
MKDRYNVLFVCTGNSARSQMAEALANSLGKGRVRAFSAGSHPAGRVQPMALQVMADAGLDVSVLRSKSWAEFAQPGAPEMDLVITVCDRAGGESCPVWPGQPITAHWSIPDPVGVTGTPEQVHKAFLNTLLLLQQRISLLLSLRMEGLDRLAAETRLRQISETPAIA